MTPVITSNLVVTAVVSGSVVWYTIHPSEDDKTALKTVRFSELDQMRERLSREVPAFLGRLPPKTLMKNTKPNFVETRRNAIEVYLRQASTDQMAKASGAWHQFFGGLPSTDTKQNPAPDNMQNKAADHDGSEDETEPQVESFSSTGCEVRELLQSKRNNLTAAQEQLQSLENDLETILCSVMSAEAEAKDGAAAENNAAARLRTHRESLAELDTQLSVKSMMNKSSERQQSEMAERLLEELQTKAQRAKKATNKAQGSAEVACRAVVDASSKARANVVAATAAKADAEKTHADALAMSVLQLRAKDRLDDVSIAERELGNFKLAWKAFDEEQINAEDLRQKADVETKTAVAAVASHIEESTCRSFAHKLEIQRATECAMNSASLRDVRSRGLLIGDDRSSLGSAEKAANVATELAAEALAKATKAADDTRSRDEAQLSALQAVAAMASKKLQKRDTILATFAARSMAHEVAMEDASAKLEAATAAPNNAIQQMFETLRRQVETCAQALAECSAELAKATKDLATVTKKHESELHLLRQAERGESQALKERQAEEAAVVKALAEAQIVATRAAAVFEQSMKVVVLGGPDINQLVKSSEAAFVDLDKAAQVAANGYKTAVETVDLAKRDLAAMAAWRDDGDDDADEDDNGCRDTEFEGNTIKERAAAKRKMEKRDAAERRRKRASCSSTIEELEPVIKDKKYELKAAALAANSAKKELNALREQQETRFCPAEMLVKNEIDLLDSCLASREHNEAAIVAEVQRKVAAWLLEQETLAPDLHRAELLVAAAEADVTTNKKLAKSLTQAKTSQLTGTVVGHTWEDRVDVVPSRKVDARA